MMFMIIPVSKKEIKESLKEECLLTEQLTTMTWMDENPHKPSIEHTLEKESSASIHN